MFESYEQIRRAGALLLIDGIYGMKQKHVEHFLFYFGEIEHYDYRSFFYYLIYSRK